MSIRPHVVLAATVVIETGETLAPGSNFTPTSAAQRDRLVEAGCLKEAPARGKPARVPDVPTEPTDPADPLDADNEGVS